MTDPITDLLNRIRNAQAVFHPTVDVPFSDLKYKIAKILERQGFIEKIEKKGRKTKKIIKIFLKYKENNNPVILKLKRISKSGQRIYSPYKKIKQSKGRMGIVIVSTSKGLMTDKEAKKQKLGGELICEIS